MKFIGGLHPAPAALSLLVGALIGAGGYTAYTSHALSYLSDDPRACANCHVMREYYDSWQKASHHARASCNGCHVPHPIVPKYVSKAVNGYHHSRGFTLQDFHEPIRIRPANRAVLNANCLACHRDLVEGIAPHPESEEDDLDCARCHRSVGHGPVK